MRTDNPDYDFDMWDAEQSKWLRRRPVCEKCGDPIQDDEYFYHELKGKVCEACWDELAAELKDNAKRWVDE